MMNKLLAVVGLLVVLVLAGAACGSDSDGSIEVNDARFRTTPNDLGAGYLTIENSTDDPITLIGASSPDVGRIELHESTMSDDGVMQMAERPEGFTVEPGDTVSLEPGGKHLMLFEPEPPGDELEFTLDFGSEQLVVMATLDEAGSASSMDEMDDTESGDGDDMDGMDDMDDMDESGG